LRRLILFSRFSDVFYVDASTKETISADLSQIALAKGIGESEKDTLDWLCRQRNVWLLLLDNADDPTLNLGLYFPRCSHGNILITTRNRDICAYAPQICQVSDKQPDEASDLSLKHARLEHNNETEAPATTIVKVHSYTCLGDQCAHYCAGTWTPCAGRGPSWGVYLQGWL